MPTTDYTITGVASDNSSGVRLVSVRVERYDVSPKEYWNGTHWTSGSRRFLSATLNADNTWALPGIDLSANGDYRIRLVVRDQANNIARAKHNPVTYFTVNSAPTDSTAPTGIVSAPIDDETIEANENFTITGTATDDLSGVKKVQIRVERFDVSPTQYWTGSKWVTNKRRYLTAHVNADDSWELTSVDLSSEGDYRIRMMLRDFSNNLARAKDNPLTVFSVAASKTGQPPVAVDDAISITAGGQAAINVLHNDSDPDGTLDTGTLTVLATPFHGDYTIEGATVIYNHDGGTATADSFTYTIADDDNNTSSAATVSITIEPHPQVAPVAQDDSFILAIGTSGLINILGNDSDINHNIDPAKIELITHATSGDLAVQADGNILYTHDGGAHPSDSFSYRVADTTGLTSAIAVVSIEIEPATNPVANNDTIRMNQGTLQVINVLGNDSANTVIDRESILITLSPQHASDFEVGSDGTIHYRHNGDNSLSDVFKYRMFNTQGMPSNEATVTITIKPALLTISDFSYEGAFKLPADQFGASSLNYANGVIEVNGDSLFIVGHNHDNAIAEFSIPTLVNSHSIAKLNSTGNPVQKFTRVINRAATGNPENLDQIVGLERVNGSLVVNMMEFYDAPANNTLTTMMIKDAGKLSTSATSAIHRMNGAARAAGWLSEVPAELKQELGASHISGHSSGDPIISRLSVGPSAFGLNLPANLQSSNSQNIPTFEFQGFSLDNPLHSDLSNSLRENSLWTHMSHARYGFIAPNTSTYVTVGWSAGHQTGVGYKNTLEDGSKCPGYCPNKSTDAYNYYWLWNIDDWARVKSGELEPHEITPYESGELNLPFQTDAYLNEIGGASYDADSGLLYISVLRANIDGYDNPPVIVALKVN
ncbi:hypothetical protein AB833_02660 [Chromatiales bacterium (ex Bugula neritina AB1)]|nr:hypothetical protein AB833_02660 [Chromatiales bacterium (ex Bugula neritina AB1)]